MFTYITMTERQESHESKVHNYKSEYRNIPPGRVRIENVGWVRPREATVSRHTSERTNSNGNPVRPVGVGDIKRAIRQGQMMRSRVKYTNFKGRGVQKSNFGVVAADDPVNCPKMRLHHNGTTAVLSSCFPLGMNQGRYKPFVVTSYRQPFPKSGVLYRNRANTGEIIKYHRQSGTQSTVTTGGGERMRSILRNGHALYTRRLGEANSLARNMHALTIRNESTHSIRSSGVSNVRGGGRGGRGGRGGHVGRGGRNTRSPRVPGRANAANRW